MNNDIGQLRLNRALGKPWRDTWLHKDSLMKIKGLKSCGVESASWATIPPILRDLMAEITRSEIRVLGHDPTNFARISQ